VADGAQMLNGQTLPADLIILATGYKGQEHLVRKLFGDEVAARIGPIWGFGDGAATRKYGNGVLDLGVIMQVDRAQLHAGRCNSLNGSKLTNSSSDAGIPQHRRPSHAWRDLRQQFEPFCTNGVLKQRKTGSIAAGPRHARD
jgi:hypothetical protein